MLNTARFWFVLCACFITTTFAVRFYISPGHQRCFTQDLPTGTKIQGTLKVSGNGDDMPIDLWVTTLLGAVLYHRCAPSHGKFTFITPESTHKVDKADDQDHYFYDHTDDEDTYRICIEHQQAHSRVYASATYRIINFHLENIDNVAVPSIHVATDQDTNRLIGKLKLSHVALRHMIDDIVQLQHHERLLTARVQFTAHRLSYLAFSSLILIALTSMLQLSYYRNYFKKSKLC